MTNEQLEQWIDDLQSGMYINCVYCGHRYGPNSGPSTKNFNITMRKALEEHISSCPKHPLSAAKDEIATLKEQVKELEVTLDLIHDADMRAIKMWQEAHPDKENMWPDQAMMVCWLMERVKDLESEHINKPPQERLVCKGCSLPFEITKYQAFWEDSRMTDKMSWEQYEWPKHQEALKEMDADQVESEILHGKIDALEADNQRLRAALENVLLAIDHEDYYNDAVFDEAREALKLAGKEGE